MYDPEVLANVFKRNQWVINEQTKGLSHPDSLIQPALRGNCLNFILGHLVVHRDLILKLVDKEPIMSTDQNARYGYGSDPVVGDGPDVISFEDLLQMLERSEASLVGALEALSSEDLRREIQAGERTTTLGERIEFYSWHETYHVGQTEYLRQLTGMDDQVI
jgi:uncharacterized damage-inducible protein DinB